MGPGEDKMQSTPNPISKSFSPGLNREESISTFSSVGGDWTAQGRDRQGLSGPRTPHFLLDVDDRATSDPQISCLPTAFCLWCVLDC